MLSPPSTFLRVVSTKTVGVVPTPQDNHVRCHDLRQILNQLNTRTGMDTI